MSTTTPTSGSLLEQLSNDLAGAVDRAGQTTVRVNARRRLPATGIVWTTQGADTIVVTASHVVERDEDVSITTPDGSEHPAALAGRDNESDLAVLRVTGVSLPVADRAAPENARVGALALAIGRAGELSATQGVVSAIGERWGRRGRRTGSLLSSDAPMFPGFSGGPLVDAGGRVLGLLSSHLGRGQTLAIPSADVDRITSAILEHGHVKRGYVGVAAQRVELPAALRSTAGTEAEFGLLVVGVEPDSPAATAGMTVGDIILSLGGRPVAALEDLRGALGTDSIGRTLAAGILRGGVPTQVEITAGEQPE
jgi:S1-C subfamily serine protease